MLLFVDVSHYSPGPRRIAVITSEHENFRNLFDCWPVTWSVVKYLTVYILVIETVFSY